MTRAFATLLLVLAVTGRGAADLPRKAPISKYTNLWQNSPFTTKPLPTEAGPAVNPLEDYALAGVSPIPNGYRVTLLNKKSPEERIFVYSSDANPKHGFKILSVTRKEGDPMGTVVRMSSGPVTGTVSYDEKLLAIAPPQPANKPPQPGQPQAQPGQPQPPPQPGQVPQRQPRPRVVPPPVPQQAPVPQQVQPAANQRSERRTMR